MDISNDNRVGKDYLIHCTLRYKQIEPGKNISHLTRVNSLSNSSIVPRNIIAFDMTTMIWNGGWR
jgi:hypothetical protein